MYFRCRTVLVELPAEYERNFVLLRKLEDKQQGSCLTPVA